MPVASSDDPRTMRERMLAGDWLLAVGNPARVVRPIGDAVGR